MALLKKKKEKVTEKNTIKLKDAAPPGKKKKAPKPEKNLKKEKNLEKEKKQKNKSKVSKLKVKNSAPVLAGIDIGSEEVKLVVGQYKRGKVYVSNVCKTKLPDRSFNDGKIERPLEVGLAIKTMLKENHIKAKKVACSIDSSQILRRNFKIPKVPEKDIPKMLKYEVEQYLPVDISSYLLQYDILEQQDDLGFIHLGVCAMPKSLATKLQTTVKNGNLIPWSLDVNSHGLEKLIHLESKYRKELKKLNIVFIDMGKSQFTLTYFEGGHCQASKKLEFGGDMLNEVFRNNLEVAENSVEQLKIKNLTNIGVPNLAKYYYQTLQSLDKVKDTEDIILTELMQVVEKWASEIKNMLLYFEVGEGSGKIDQIYLYGGSSQIKDLDIYIEDFLKIPSVALEKMECVKFSKKLGADFFTTYLNALGALIRF